MTKKHQPQNKNHKSSESVSSHMHLYNCFNYKELKLQGVATRTTLIIKRRTLVVKVVTPCISK